MEENERNDQEEKEKRKNREIAKLRQLFSRMDRKTKSAVHSLIENAAFMTVLLEDLQDKINRNGITETYQNGKDQFGVKKSIDAEMYIATIKSHMGIMKQLTDLLAKTKEDNPGKDDDGFDGFVNNK